MSERYKFTYFALWAKGPAPALALAFSGLDWVGDDAGTGAKLEHSKSEWRPKNKAKAAWNLLPNLETPNDGMKIGHEGAILNFIGRKVPSMAGETDQDFAASQQLFFVGEDIYNKLVAFIDTTFEAKGKSAERDQFWGMTNENTHNYQFGIRVYLKQLEDFYTKCGYETKEGKFTSSGTTIGECKIFSSLHACVMIKGDVLIQDFASVMSFYKRFLNEKTTQSIILDGGNYPHIFSQYFIDTASN